MTGSTTPIAIVGVGTILPDAPDVATFWRNLERGRYSISDVQPDRWDPDLYFDPDPKAPERTYSKIGGWVREWDWSPLAWHLPIPPKVGDAMDDAQKWAVACTHAALTDYGWPERTLDSERTAVILGNAMAGEKHYQTALRIAFPEIARELAGSPSFTGLPADVRAAIAEELHGRLDGLTPAITEDTMPGELGNCIAGRVANLFDLHGPNYIVDAACASAMAAFDASIAGLAAGTFDVAISGGIDRNMGAATYVKFCKIGALSATGTRPFDVGADGFVMGEGAALFVLKRLADAERDGDRIYAVVRGIGGASDGRGKGITAPNPVGQRMAVERAWRNAGLSPEVCSLVEAHGTSTRVGDVVEVSSIADVFATADIAPGSIALGSVKSNIGHLKAAAGAAGLLKATLALHAKSIPPSLGFREPNPNIDWATSPFHVNTELTEWKVPAGQVRCAGVSAFGFGGTNFHAVLEEYVPGHLRGDGPRIVAVGADFSATATTTATTATATAAAVKAPLRGALVLGAATEAELGEQLRAVQADAAAGRAPAPEAPTAAALAAPERIAIDYADADELADKAAKALDALARGGAAWKLLQGRGVFRGHGPAGKVAFLYTGQGSQYANMLRTLRDSEPAVAATFAEADVVMTPLLGRSLSDVIFVDPASPERMADAEAELQRTEITQPAVLAVDIALTRLLGEYGVAPDMVMGHSLGEYGALVAAGSLSFPAALEAVSARGHEMAHLAIDDAGLMVAVMGPIETAEEIVASIDGNVVLANVNSTTQSVIGGATDAVLAAERACAERGLTTARLPVSHAFHTSIVAPVSEPLRRTLERLELRSPVLPIIANVTGDFYPTGPDVVPEMLDLLARQVAAPVQFVAGLRRLADAGATVFVEVGPKWALRGFVADVLGNGPGGDDIVNLATNHPKAGDIVSFNQALCGLYAAGLGRGRTDAAAAPASEILPPERDASMAEVIQTPVTTAIPPTNQAPMHDVSTSDRVHLELGRLFAEFLDRGRTIYEGAEERVPADRVGDLDEPVVITGAALGTPGTTHVFDDANLGLLLNGEQFIHAIPTHIRNEILEHRITRLVKSDHGASFEAIDSPDDVLKLAARAGALDLVAEFGVDPERVAAYGRTTQLAVGAGFDALRDAGIPLAMRYKTTHLGTYLPERWGLPDEMRDDTGVIFASAFPGIEEFASESRAFATDHARREERTELEAIRVSLVGVDGADVALAEIDRRLHDLRKLIDDDPYGFDRRFLFHVLSMGHSQFADLIGARGPNTQINSACASTTQAVALAQDWIRAGRCRRVVVVAADDVTSDELLGWFGSGFLASGAAATDEDVTEAAIPFDRRRHGMILGMGAAALVVESAETARQRGLRPICEVLGTATANSAFHGTRLDVDHIGDVMEQLVAGAEARTGIDRHAIAPATVFMSHETYTPARGGSASAEIFALRRVFGADADRVVIANTKGFTGHPMGVGLEDVVAVKSLETGIVPPVANFREPDPELGSLNLSKGGSYPVEYALRLAAGFGSQISMLLLRRTPAPDGQRRGPDELGYAYRISDPARFGAWLKRISGDPAAELEVAKRRLQLVDHGPAATNPGPVPAAPSAAVLLPAPTEPPAAVEPATMVEPVAVAEPVTVVEAAVAPAEVSIEAVAERIVTLVAEQTGYPAEMLAPDLDLEADLGIDTVKQAELFAKIREEYGIERDDNLKLRDYPTINHVVDFVRDRTPQPSTTPRTATTQTATEPVAATEPVGGAEAAIGYDGESDAFPRRVPVVVLRPALEHCVPTGVTLGTGSRVFVLADTGGVASALVEGLHQLGVDTLVVDDAPDADALVAVLASWRESGPITGVYWLPALDDEGLHATLAREAWTEGIRIRVKLLAAAMRELYGDIAQPGTFLVSATRLGGQHGYGPAGATAPMGGAVTGFTKAYARERPDALVKAVDFGSVDDATVIAGCLLAETRRDPGVVEIGHLGGDRWSVALAPEPAADGGPERTLTSDSVFVITGAAGSIVSAITADLAVCGGTFHLLDLVPEPDPSDHDLERFVTDRDGLKLELAERIAASGERATPARVGVELARLERAQAAADTIAAVRRAGGSVHWHQVDLTDGDAVGAVFRELQASHARIDVLLHAAGLEISHTLDNKPTREYDLVFGVKGDGWFNLMHGLGDLALGTAVVFSSIAGRFGNGGQTDYSAANDLLCKCISNFRSTRPESRGIAIDWTAWASIGMASRGSIPKMMELAGIDMLPPETGVPVVRHEITAGGPGGEVVVAGGLGMLLAERDGLDAVAARSALDTTAGPMLGVFTGWTMADGLAVSTALDPVEQRFLDHHRIDGTPVLPGVMGIEGFAEVASASAPGWTAVAVEDVAFSAPCKFFRDESRELELVARPRLVGDDVVADCRLLARRSLANQSEQLTTHFSGRVRLTRAAVLPLTLDPGAAPAGEPSDRAVGADDVYRIYFHGPAYQVVDAAWRDADRVVGRLADDLPPDHQPDGAPLLFEPRLIELCFQTAGILELGTTGRLALPLRVGRVSLFPVPDQVGRWRAVVTARADGRGVDATVVDDAGHVRVALDAYETISLPGGTDEGALEPLRRAVQ
ncbi:MAG TPA: SDR family NAD(P)-dependent oxidoreductase [Ilumatobacteraceae bacterium]|nr:SDR family NAD(P)-dependent oxidoreductase [Ilumatobacteraceae bacterium]